MNKNLIIGNLRVSYPMFPAPMAGLTDPPFRKLIDNIGYIGAVFTEMISVEGLIRKNTHTLEMIREFDSSFPVFIQLFGSDPESFSEASKFIENETDFKGIDINMGCPVNKIIKKGAGSFLLTQPDKIKAIIKSIKRVSCLPLTVKLRLGFNKINILETIKIVEESGADALIVHFRTKKQKFSGKALWDYAENIREGINIPLIGNGDIIDIDTAKERLELADGIMIGRGMLSNPSIFSEIAGKKGKTKQEILIEFMQLIEEFYPYEKLSLRIKAFLRYFLKGTGFSKELKRKIFHCKEYEKIKEILFEKFF